MSKKANQSLFGIILLIIGIYILTYQYINIGALRYLVVGATLLLLYHTRRKIWALLTGIPLIAYGAISFAPFDLSNISGALILLIMSVIFFILFFTHHATGYLITGCILFWIGIYLLALQLNIVTNSKALALVCFGLAFLSIYKFGKYILGKWSLYLGVFFLMMGILFFISIDPFKFIGAPVIVGVSLILGSIYFIKKGLNK